MGTESGQENEHRSNLTLLSMWVIEALEVFGSSHLIYTSRELAQAPQAPDAIIVHVRI